jgi:hypothetical protein
MEDIIEKIKKIFEKCSYDDLNKASNILESLIKQKNQTRINDMIFEEIKRFSPKDLQRCTELLDIFEEFEKKKYIIDVVCETNFYISNGTDYRISRNTNSGTINYENIELMREKLKKEYKVYNDELIEICQKIDKTEPDRVIYWLKQYRRIVRECIQEVIE